MKKNYNDRPLKIFVSYLAGQKKMFAIDMGCSALVALIDLAFPYVSRMSMTKLLPNKQFETFFVVMAVMVLCFVLKAVLNYVITTVGHGMGVLVEADMRRDVFTHMQDLSCSFYDKNRTGILMSRVTSDLFEITELAHHGPENLLICSITMIGALIFMIRIDWRLGLAITIVMPVCLWFTLSQRIRMMKTNVEVKRKTAEISASIESSISGIRTAKAFANEDVEREKFDEANMRYRGAKNGYFKMFGLFNSGMDFSCSIANVLVIALGGYFIMRGSMDYVDLISFSLYVASFVAPIRKLAQTSEIFMQGAAGFSRFLEIMRTEPQIEDAPDAEALGNVEGGIRFEDVSFDYGNGVPVLEGINLDIKPGECLAVVGPSGGGKTTLCQLIPRFYDVCSGSVSVDGKDVRSVTQQSLRRNIGMIQQDVFMFAGTIRDNIRYGRPDASDAEIIEAAKRAQVHDEIMELPDGYDSYIGERGVMLSGGQKQRISIARVFLKNPKILIMDEATSALDTVTEQRIQASLDELSRGRTSIIVAHRLSTVRGADEIIVIDGEHIVERGSHAALIAQNGVYAGLCKAQSLG